MGLCLLVVIVMLITILGMIGMMILIGLLVALPFIILDYLTRHRAGRTAIITTSVVVLMVIIGIGIIWWRSPSRQANNQHQTTVQAKVMPYFHWGMAPGGKTKTGYAQSTFTADITKNDGMLFWVDLYDVKGALVGDLRFRKEEGKLVGRMKNHKDGTCLPCYLIPDGKGWTGSATSTNQQYPITCWLRYR